MEFPPHALTHIRECLQKANITLAKARQAFLESEADVEHQQNLLIQKALGKSHAERLVNAKASQEWLALRKRHARIETAYDYRKLEYAILDKEWLAQHLALKLDNETIKRG